MKIHIAVVNHHYGCDCYVGATRSQVWAQLYDFAVQYWSELPSRALPSNGFINKEVAVNYYFEMHPDDRCDFWFDMHVPIARKPRKGRA